MVAEGAIKQPPLPILALFYYKNSNNINVNLTISSYVQSKNLQQQYIRYLHYGRYDTCAKFCSLRSTAILLPNVMSLLDYSTLTIVRTLEPSIPTIKHHKGTKKI